MQSTDNQSEPTQSENTASNIVGYLLLFTGIFSLSWLITFGWQNREMIIDLYAQANMERYRIAVGDTGPATFHVYHKDFNALEQLARNNDEILGIEMTKNTKVAAMAFTSQDVSAISTVREHPMVSNMIRRNIPMICH